MHRHDRRSEAEAMHGHDGREDVMTETTQTRPGAGRSGAFAWSGGMLGRLGLLAAVLALALVGAAVGRTAEPAAAQATATAVSLRGAPGLGSRYIMQDTPDLRTLNFDNLASFAFADYRPVALYSDAQYQGRCQTIEPGMSVPLAGSFVGDKQVSSVRMAPCRSTDLTDPVWRGNPSATGSGSYVGDVKVISGSSYSISCGEGWQKALDEYYATPSDLNAGAGGSFVFLCTRWHNQPTFRHITSVAGNGPNTPCPTGYKKVPGDLNQGAGGKYIYFCVLMYGGPIPSWGMQSVVNVEFATYHASIGLAAAESAVSQRCRRPVSWNGEPATKSTDLLDLNKGAGGAGGTFHGDDGKFIFICLTTVLVQPTSNP